LSWESAAEEGGFGAGEHRPWKWWARCRGSNELTRTGYPQITPRNWVPYGELKATAQHDPKSQVALVSGNFQGFPEKSSVTCAGREGEGGAFDTIKVKK